MNTRTWDIYKRKDYKYFSMHDDRVVIQKSRDVATTAAKEGSEQIIPFDFITTFTAVDSSPELHIEYRTMGKFVSTAITFKSSDARDEAFNVLTELLSSEYSIEISRPKKWTKVLSPLLVVPVLAFFTLLTYMVKDFESGKGFGLGSPKDTLETLIHAALKIIVVVGAVIGSKILFYIIGILFLIAIGVTVYLALTTPALLPEEKRLQRHQIVNKTPAAETVAENRPITVSNDMPPEKSELIEKAATTKKDYVNLSSVQKSVPQENNEKDYRDTFAYKAGKLWY